MGYNSFAANVGVGKESFDGRLESNYAGLQAYLTGTF